MEKKLYDNYLMILRAEMIPSMGCTEPIAVAYAAAKARAVLGKMPERMNMICSGNIVKNVQGVTVPNSGGQKGVALAATLGVVGGNADKELEVLSEVTPEQIEETKALAAADFCNATLAEGVEGLYIRAEVFAGEESAVVELKEKHNFIALIEKNGEVIFTQDKPDPGASGNKSLMSLETIYEFASTAALEDVKELMLNQVETNRLICEEGMKNHYGADVGKMLLKLHSGSDSFSDRAAAFAAAGSDARMSGCAMAVIINSGSGNQGITIAAPICKYAEEHEVSEETLVRGLTIANLLAIHQKQFIGNLSAYCGATSSGCASAAGIAFMEGASLETIGHTLINASNTIGGMICDGAKSSCASKIATAVSTGLLAYEMAKNDSNLMPGEGVIVEDMEQSIRNIGRVGRVGMKGTDVEVLNIMLGKVQG